MADAQKPRRQSRSTKPSAPMEDEFESPGRFHSPPPSYSSLFPGDAGRGGSSSYNRDSDDDTVFAAAVTNSRRPRRSERRRSDRTSCGGGRQYFKSVYMDDIAKERNSRNRERMKSGNWNNLEEIEVFPHTHTSRGQPYLARVGEDSSYSMVIPSSPERRPRGIHGRCGTESSSVEDSMPEYALLPALSKDDVMRTIADHVQNQTCCYNTNVRGSLRIKDVESKCIWHLYMQTIAESRQLSEGEEPYTGGHQSESRTPPSMWDIRVEPSHDFRTKIVKIPHTTTVHTCDSCSGKGHSSCSKCKGSGHDPCWYCHGNGHTLVHESHYETNENTNHQELRGYSRHETCHHCGGDGRIVCCSCHGNCKNICYRCNDTGKLEQYSQVTVQWSKQTHRFFSGKSMLPMKNPDDLLKRCKGPTVYKRTGIDIPPISMNDCLNSDVVRESKKYVDIHRELLHGKQIHSQRQIVRLVPVYKVIADIKGTSSTFWIIGENNHVYSLDYPRQRACNIL